MTTKRALRAQVKQLEKYIEELKASHEEAQGFMRLNVRKEYDALLNRYGDEKNEALRQVNHYALGLPRLTITETAEGHKWTLSVPSYHKFDPKTHDSGMRLASTRYGVAPDVPSVIRAASKAYGPLARRNFEKAMETVESRRIGE